MSYHNDARHQINLLSGQQTKVCVSFLVRNGDFMGLRGRSACDDARGTRIWTMSWLSWWWLVEGRSDVPKNFLLPSMDTAFLISHEPTRLCWP
jgi:hypothetical protein